MKHLDKAIRGLRKQANDVAKLVRGLKELRPGRHPGEISPRHHAVIGLVRQRTQEGLSDEQILEEVNRRFDRGLFGIEDDFTLEEVRYLKTLPFEDGAQ